MVDIATKIYLLYMLKLRGTYRGCGVRKPKLKKEKKNNKRKKLRQV